MNEIFVIPVVYKNETIDFTAQLFTSAFSYQIQVLVNEIPINFERDDSGNFRAIAALPEETRMHKIDNALLQAIANEIETLLS